MDDPNQVEDNSPIVKVHLNNKFLLQYEPSETNSIPHSDKKIEKWIELLKLFCHLLVVVESWVDGVLESLVRRKVEGNYYDHLKMQWMK